jgi:two-component system, chemotaxis family, CheB/CheR fusion protein
MASKKKKVAPAEKPATPSVFPIVGIGASAGGIEAVTELFEHLPPDPGMAFVVVIHHDHRTASDLAGVLAHATSLNVTTIDGLKPVESNHVYVAPPGSDIEVAGRSIRATRRKTGDDGLQIDNFFRTLAKEQGTRAIGIVLSGAASDGTYGLKAIKEEGGITFAQDESAQFSSMPRHAVAAGSVDFILSPRAIASELVNMSRNPYLTETAEHLIKLPETDLGKIYAILKGVHQVDFTHYKPTTVERRIRRRMAMQKVDRVEDYLDILMTNPVEVELLFGDILIRVTGFFRDPDVFDAIRKEIAPALVADRGVDDPIRIWVPGCATGEEVYSLAITFQEAAADAGRSCPMQIFGTDVSEVAIERARLGFYPADIAVDVSPDRLRRYFTQADGGFRVAKSVRDCCVFARQNVTKDPPFSRLDLISCRNVMIYLGATLQRKAMSVFHYALRSHGYLILGSSESIGNFGDLFIASDRKHKIYQKRPGVPRQPMTFEAPTVRLEIPVRHAAETTATTTGVFREADRLLLNKFTPPAVVINDRMEIMQFRGRISPFLEPAPGQATFDILKMAKPGLLADLRAAIHGARKIDAPVRREGVRVGLDGEKVSVDVEVVPIPGPSGEHYQLVLFHEARPEPEKQKKGRAAMADSRETVRLRRELEATREYLQSIIEEQEAMNEELRSANEEIQSANEELQSTNEELETAKEELQSSNEELTTLNEELENRNSELADVNNDLVNLLASIDIPIVMLDRSLLIRRFNAGAQRALNLIPADVGRPMNELSMSLIADGIEGVVADVIERLEVREMDVTDRSGKKYRVRIRPYKTTDSRIEGAVLALVERV